MTPIPIYYSGGMIYYSGGMTTIVNPWFPLTKIMSMEEFKRIGIEIPYPQLFLFGKFGKIKGLIRKSFSFPESFFYVAFVSTKQAIEQAVKENREYVFLVKSSHHKAYHFVLPVFKKFPNEEGVITYVDVLKKNINKVKRQDGLHHFKFYVKGILKYKIGGEKEFSLMMSEFEKTLNEDSELFFSIVNFMGTRR